MSKRRKVNNDDTAKLSGVALNLALRWLHPADVSRCCQVCRKWHHEIGEDVWKQVAASNASSAALQAMVHSGLDHRSIARGLTQPKLPTPGEFINFPEPNLQAQDFLLLVELKTKEGQTVGAWCRDCSPWGSGDEVILIDDDEPPAAGSAPHFQ